MRGGRNIFISIVANIFVFALLEAAALMLISGHSIVQRSKIMAGLDFITSAFVSSSDAVTGFFGLRKANAVLAQENALLRAENGRLAAMLETVPDSTFSHEGNGTFSFIPAKVIANSSDSRHNSIIINKGTADGIEEGMGVVTDKGIIGYILKAGEHYSKISSLMDTDNMASATLKRDNTFGVLQWDGTRMNELTLHDIPVHTTFSTGDTVISSGYSLIYPAGIPIGTVSGKELRDGVNYSLTISTFEKYTSLSYVYVAVRNDIEELNRLMETEDEE